MGSLTDIKIRNLKPQERPYQVADGDGLILEVRPSGQKAWLYRYRVHGRQEKLSLGDYPEISLARSRELHFEARRQVTEGKSPATSKREEKRRLSDDLQTVRGLAKAYIDDHVSHLVSASRAQAYIQQKILPAIGGSFLHEVTPADCVAIVEKIKRAGAPAVARKVLEQLRGLFGWAISAFTTCAGPPQPTSTRWAGTRTSSRRHSTTPSAASGGATTVPNTPRPDERCCRHGPTISTAWRAEEM